jgi:hypothetical protein
MLEEKQTPAATEFFLTNGRISPADFLLAPKTSKILKLRNCTAENWTPILSF